MSELELELRELGSAVAFPPTPELGGRVLKRLQAAPRGRLVGLDRRVLALAVAVVALALAGILAVPPARTALLEWLGLRGVSIELVDELPAVPVTEYLDLGEPTTLEQARRQAGFAVREPGELGVPDRVYFRDRPAGGQVAFVYGSERRVRLLLTQFAADYEPYVSKIVDTGARVETVEVDGERGVWIEGVHYFNYVDEAGGLGQEFVRIVNRVLLWQDDGVTFRLEADITKDRALEIAAALD